MLWLWDKTWPELIHPFASAIDTELPVAEEMVCVKGDSKPEYVRWPEVSQIFRFTFYVDTGVRLFSL